MNRIERAAAAAEAISNRDLAALEDLLARNVDLAAVRLEDGTTLLMRALYYRWEEGVDRLSGRELDLFEAAALGRAEVVVTHLEHGVDLAARSADGFSALHLAAFFGQPEVVERLLARGASVDTVAENPSLVMPLHSAVAGGSKAVVALLVEAGAPLDAKQQGGYTPLMAAAANGLRDLVHLLLDSGADASLTSDDGKIAAAFAKEKGHEDLSAEIGAAGT